jgi:hypothetical protein
MVEDKASMHNQKLQGNDSQEYDDKQFRMKIFD